MPEAEGELPPSYLRELDKQIKALIESVWDRTSPADGMGMLKLIGKTLHGNMINGFGKSFTSVDWSTPDADMLVRLTRDVWQFSAAKNYQQLRDMTLALRGDGGKPRSFAEFEEKALAINSQYNRTWLATEYSQALNSATMAARWNDFTRNAKDMPYLRYRTVGDNNVRNEHKLLDGITRKVDDAFWSTHFPPNGWKCRCDVEQLDGSRAKETDVIPNASIPPIFQTNLAKTGLIFPNGHPYYVDVPAGVLQKAVASLPDDVAYQRVYKSELSGKKVEIHIMHGAAEASANLATAKVLADKGYNVRLLPILGKEDDILREIIYGTKNFVPGKNPDALIDKVLYDFKNCVKASKSAIHNGIEEANGQVGKAIIRLPDQMADAEIHRHVKGKMNQARYIDEVWVINADGNLSKFTLENLGLPNKAKRPTR